MQKYHDIVLDNKGNAVLSATITVTDNPGGGVSTIYSDNGVTSLTNPFTASGVDGAYSFYAAGGRYDINIAKTGFTTESLTDILLEDINRPANVITDLRVKGDGVTDDAAAIQSAFDLGKSLYFPEATYKCDSEIEFPANISDIVIYAEEATFDFTHATQDGIKIHGAIRCRLYFGYIKTNGTGAAIKIDPVTNGYSENILTWRGLTGTSRTGTGLSVVNNTVGASVSKFIGSDISEFAKGISIVASGGSTNIDTMQFEFNYIRTCDVSVYENGSGGSTVNGCTWKANIEASASGDIALQTNAQGQKYEITHFAASGGTVFQLDSGAKDNTFTIVNPWTQAAFTGSTFVTDNSGNSSNIFLPGHPTDRIVETNDTTASGITLTAAGLVGGIYRRSGPTGTHSDTTDTAANIIALIPNPVVGTTFQVTIINGVAFLKTILAGTGITLAGTNSVPANNVRQFVGRITNVGTPALIFNGL